MTNNWKNKIKKINFRYGLDRFYFVLMIVWFLGWFIASINATFSTQINHYTDNPNSFLLVFLILIFPYIVYVVLIALFKIFAWVLSGFLNEDKAIEINVFFGEKSFFGIVRKKKKILIKLISLFVISSVIIAFYFSTYSSYKEKREAKSRMDSIVLPKLPKLPDPPKLPELPSLPKL